MKAKKCLTCGHIGVPKIHTPGSFGVELVLWLFFLVPGLIYSIWRLSGRGPVCARCGQKVLVPPTMAEVGQWR